MPSYVQYKKMLAVLDENDDDITWITVKGNHIPIKKGQEKGEAIKEFFEKKSEKSQESGSGKSEKKDYTIAHKDKSGNTTVIAEVSHHEIGGGNKEETKQTSGSAGGRVPKQYRKAYSDMMERVHKSANTEVTEEDGKKGAIELAKQLGKPYGEKEISQRIADYGDYRLKAPLVKNDKGKMVEVDTQMKYKKGGKFVDGEYKGGEYTPARYAVQQKIIWKAFEGWEDKVPKTGKPKLVILGGRGGSGKSHFTKGENAQYPKDKFVVIDPDAFKESLPEYKNLVDSGDKYAGLNAWEVHEESSDMKKRALEMAKNLGVNTVLDGTLSKYSSVKKVVDEFKKAGYDVEGAYMHLPREKSTARGILRGMNGRFVPVGQLLAMKENEDVFEQLMSDFSKWTIYDNDVPFGEKPKLVAKSE